MRYSLPVLLVGTMLATPASAQWKHIGSDNPFGDALNVAAARKEGHDIAFRCSTKDDLSLLYILPEKGRDNDDLANLNLVASPKLLVIIDDQPKVSLSAEVDLSRSSNYRVAVEDADEVLPVLVAAMNAKRRFAVANEIMGKVVYHKTYNVQNLKASLQKLVKLCNLDLPSS
jgi:hypothetical protein